MKTRAIFVLPFLLALPGSAAADSMRTFVSGHGNDTGSCTYAAPCRSFAYAVAQTAAGGELDVLDTAGYGTVTLTRAISIVNDGNIASVAVPSAGTGIVIDAGASDIIHLRGITVEGAGSGHNGIVFKQGASLEIEKCVVRNLTGSGISANLAVPGSVIISETLVSDVALSGIVVEPTGSDSLVTASFSRVEVRNSGLVGINVSSTQMSGKSAISATATDCVVASGRGAGTAFLARADAASIWFAITRSTTVGHDSSTEADGRYAEITVGASNFEGTRLPLTEINGGLVFSYGDNYWRGLSGLHQLTKT